LMGGAVITKVADDELFQRVRALQASGGAIPSPFDCWLVLRGIQTLPWRVRGHAANAMKLATFLAEHRRVEAVHYPGLASHPAHALAARQMRGFPGMLSFQGRGHAGDALVWTGRVALHSAGTR